MTKGHNQKTGSLIWGGSPLVADHGFLSQRTVACISFHWV